MLAYPLSPGRLCLPDQAVSTLNCSRSWQCHQLHIRFVATATPPLKGGALSPAFRLCLSLYLSMSVCLCLTLLLCNFVSVSLSLCLSVSVSLHLCISFSFHEAAPHSLSLSLPSPSKKLSTQALFARCVLLFLTCCESSWFQPVKVSLAPFSNIGSETQQAPPSTLRHDGTLDQVHLQQPCCSS